MKEIVQSVLHNTFENHDSPGTIEHELFTEIRNALIPEIRAKLLPEIRRIVQNIVNDQNTASDESIHEVVSFDQADLRATEGVPIHVTYLNSIYGRGTFKHDYRKVKCAGLDVDGKSIYKYTQAKHH